jgi:outer membrane protein insertion porin family
MMKEQFRRILFLFILLLPGTIARTQTEDKYASYTYPEDYTIAGITVSGVKFLEPNALIGISGLRIGQKVTIPGEQVTASVKKLWDQGLFSDVRITIVNKDDENVWLDIYLQERPRLSSVKFEGIKNRKRQISRETQPSADHGNRSPNRAENHS